MQKDVQRNRDNSDMPPRKRYVLGRNNDKKGRTINYHTNPYFGCVTANKFTNRETWIIEIYSDERLLKALHNALL